MMTVSLPASQKSVMCTMVLVTRFHPRLLADLVIVLKRKSVGYIFMYTNAQKDLKVVQSMPQ